MRLMATEKDVQETGSGDLMGEIFIKVHLFEIDN